MYWNSHFTDKERCIELNDSHKVTAANKWKKWEFLDILSDSRIQALFVRSRCNESSIHGTGMGCRRMTEWKTWASSAMSYPAPNLLRYFSEKGEREREYNRT